MRLSWGWGITIFIVCFIAFILTLVVKAFQTQTDLYAEDYYKQEVEFQDAIEAKSLGIAYKDSFNIHQNNNYVLIEFPAFIKDCKKESVVFYRPSNAKLDRVFSFKATDDNILRLDKAEFKPGEYEIKYNWLKNGKAYLVKTIKTIE